jgi:hypothetical protein
MASLERLCVESGGKLGQPPFFRTVSNNRTGELDSTITPDGVCKLVCRYALAQHATAATNALDPRSSLIVLRL